VTGASGFIGKTLITALTKKGIKVVALARHFNEALTENNLVECINVSGIAVPELARILPVAEYDCMFHLAWAGTSGPTRASYEIQLDNVKMTCQYVELAKAINCKRVVYASSINEMETYEYLQSDNIEPAGGYIYGTSKLAAHLMGETVAYNGFIN
jgi:nucleoside-diphosphate-sugar epimerase